MGESYFSAFGSHYNLHYFTGEAVARQTIAETNVAGTDGGEYVREGFTPLNVSIPNAPDLNVLFKGNDGEEMSFAFESSEVSLANGHVVTVFWAIKLGKEKGENVAIFNHKLGEVTPIFSGISSLRDSNVFYRVIAFFEGVFAFMSISGFGLTGLVFILILLSRGHAPFQILIYPVMLFVFAGVLSKAPPMIGKSIFISSVMSKVYGIKAQLKRAT